MTLLARPPLHTAQLPCCVITGYHRSGTSLIASLLQSAGLDIGSELLGPARDNKPGHFEDLQILRFHEKVLTAQDLDPNGFIDQAAVQVPPGLRAEARALIDERTSGTRPWGWKDPRTVLFLDFWKTLVPHLHFILLFRHPAEVVDSLFRRGDPVFQANPTWAVRTWLAYNRAMLNFANRYPKCCLLVETRAVVDEPGLLTDAIQRRFGFHLDRPANLYEKELLHQPTVPHQPSPLDSAFPEMLYLLEELRMQAALALPANKGERSANTALQEGQWALRYWLEYRRAEHREKTAEEMLLATRADLEQARLDLERTKAPLSVRLMMKAREWWKSRRPARRW
jgi:hypothetical protein